MVRELCKDPFLLARKSRPATPEDAAIAQDLLDTLHAHRETCVGMAANMIGQPVCIIAFADGNRELLLLNPVLLKKSAPYDAQEGCLSLPGVRPCKRYKTIKVQGQTMQGKPFLQTYTGFTAEIIQHELDHLNGILI